MAEFLQNLSLFPLVLTVGAYQVGLWCQKKSKTPLCNPILIGAVLVIGVLLLTGFPNERYQESVTAFSWLLTPATVCLALPLYNQLKILKSNLVAILTGILAGMLACLVCVILLCRVFALENTITISMLPKSVTAAIGVVLSEQNGGIGPLTAASISITGIIGSLFGSGICKLLRITDPVAQGVAFGTASHVIGTSRANELGDLQGAVSSLSLAVAGILTAIAFPLILLLV